MLETVSHNPELDFKMNIHQLVKVQIVKGIKHLMATAAQICHRIKIPIHILIHSKMNTVMKRKKNNFEEYYDEYYDEDENHSAEYYGEDEDSFEEG